MAEYIERKIALSIREPSKSDRHYQTYNLDDAYGQGWDDALCCIESIPIADVAPVRHGRCPICSGRKILTQDCNNGYSVEVDAEQGEMSIWQGDTCLTVISIDYCPNCGAKMDEVSE